MRKRHRIKRVVIHERGVLLVTTNGDIFFPYSEFGVFKLRIHAKHLLHFFTLPVNEDSLAPLVGRYIYGRVKKVSFNGKERMRII